MRHPNPYECDYCQTQKGPANHWWIRDVMHRYFLLMQWDEKEAAGDGKEHICSEGCAAKALSKWIGVANEPAEPVRQAAAKG